MIFRRRWLLAVMHCVSILALSWSADSEPCVSACACMYACVCDSTNPLCPFHNCRQACLFSPPSLIGCFLITLSFISSSSASVRLDVTSTNVSLALSLFLGGAYLSSPHCSLFLLCRTDCQQMGSSIEIKLKKKKRKRLKRCIFLSMSSSFHNNSQLLNMRQ